MVAPKLVIHASERDHKGARFNLNIRHETEWRRVGESTMVDWEGRLTRVHGVAARGDGSMDRTTGTLVCVVLAIPVRIRVHGALRSSAMGSVVVLTFSLELVRHGVEG